MRQFEKLDRISFVSGWKLCGTTLTWSGDSHATSFRAISSTVAQSKDPELGGFLTDYEVTFSLLLEDFPTLPTPGQTVIERGVTYRVVRSENEEGAATISIRCAGVNK